VYQWYGGLAGTWFSNHPAIQPAAIDVADREHPSTRRGGNAAWCRHYDGGVAADATPPQAAIRGKALERRARPV
jgi:hypothetical protein